MKPEYVDKSGEYYFFHSLVGGYPSEHFKALSQGQDRWDNGWDFVKIRNFLWGPDNPQAMEEHIGLPYKEVMCTLSTIRNAVTYHLPYGLVLSGDVRVCFNNDSGLRLSEQGTYEGKHFDFAQEVTVRELAETYTHKYREAVQGFTWDEVILKPGSRIVGAFHDPNISDFHRRPSRAGIPENAYEEFLRKCERLTIPIQEIDAKWK